MSTDKVVCKCGSSYESKIEIKVVEGVKIPVTDKKCPGCQKNDNWLIAESMEQVKLACEEEMAWARLEAERQSSELHYPKDCLDSNCHQCDPRYKQPV